MNLPRLLVGDRVTVNELEECELRGAMPQTAINPATVTATASATAYGFQSVLRRASRAVSPVAASAVAGPSPPSDREGVIRGRPPASIHRSRHSSTSPSHAST